MNELLTQLPNLGQDINLSKTTLNNFYKKLCETTYKLNNYNHTRLSESIEFLNEFPDHLRIPAADFVDPELYSHVHKSKGFYQQFNKQIQDRYFTVYLYLPCSSPDKERQEVTDYFDECINKIFLWLHFIVPNIKDGCSKKLTIHLLLNSFKKKLPADNLPITYKHVNSAFTSSCSPETYIYIFRQAEWFKVLIHECFHCFGLDFSHHDNSEVENKIKRSFKVHNENGIRVYEAYVELWAEVLNIVFISYLKTKDKKNYLILFQHLINKELSFTLFQCTKILNHLNLSYDEINDEKCDIVKFEETASLTAYYFLKFILFFHLRSFESWCKKNNFKLFGFKKENMLNFVDFIVERSKTTKLKKSVQKMKLFYKQSHLSDIAKKTMKMTIIS